MDFVKRLKKDKKGSLQDLFIIIGILLFFSFIGLISLKMLNNFNDVAQGIDLISSDPLTSAASNDLTSKYGTTINSGFLLLAIGLSLASMILASLVRISPIFIFIFILLLPFVVIVSGVASNVFQEMAAAEVLATEVSQLTFISHIMTYLPFFVSIIGVLIMVVSYKLWKNAQEF